MKVLLLLFASAVAAAVATAGTKKSISTSSFGKTYAPGDLIFEDNFDTLFLGVWDYEANMNGGGNNEFQVYDRDDVNAYAKNGLLHIKPTLTLDKFGGNYETLYNGYHWVTCCTDPPRGGACDRQANYPNILQPAHSARLRTKGKFSFRYGKVEVRAKIPRGDWMWPAIWMMPEDSKYGGWPTSGEIDIMESRGNRELFNPAGQNIGTEQVGSTLHFGPFWPHNGYWATNKHTNSPANQGFDRDFHLYGLEWTDAGMTFSLDNVVYNTITPPPGGFFEMGAFPEDIPNPWVNGTNPRMAPFDEKFHFILNVAVGGNFFPTDSTPPRPWGTAETFLSFWEARDSWNSTWQGDDAAMQIDYIRVWAV
jgi:beta-glucanase (GH16 family)